MSKRRDNVSAFSFFMDRLQASFLTGAGEPKFFPESSLPEIAFLGRSNVGKSSLINNLVHRKQLAKTSSTPGKTQQINFFDVGATYMLVDVPGFGYAKVSKTDRAKWAELTKTYLKTREQLTLTLYLIDSRHDPSAIDLGMIEWMENEGVKYTLVLTKTDKLKEKHIAEREQQIKDLVAECSHCVDVVPHSSVNHLGKKNLLAIIRKVCEGEL